MEQGLYEFDLRRTRENRSRLQSNPNLLHWYRRLYHFVFDNGEALRGKTVLEIGSGTSPLQRFYPAVITSDILDLTHFDHVFDCHDIDRYSGIPDNSVDLVTLTNVLHHLKDPLRFLKNVTVKLKAGGRVVMIEPYFSLVSYPIYRLLHHEPVDFGVAYPGLVDVEGPLSNSNQAVPYMIFFSRPAWRAELSTHYDLDATSVRHFSSLSYMLTGGISRRLPIPRWLYKPICSIDCRLATIAPRLFASFFVVELTSLN
ncbi:MAG: class I SAM-dependent methyltransferase [Chitinophagaceae bacterium]|nr:class I SAM-dependent methyltransferase [Rubrivivax sp.]